MRLTNGCSGWLVSKLPLARFKDHHRQQQIRVVPFA